MHVYHQFNWMSDAVGICNSFVTHGSWGWFSFTLDHCTKQVFFSGCGLFDCKKRWSRQKLLIHKNSNGYNILDNHAWMNRNLEIQTKMYLVQLLGSVNVYFKYVFHWNDLKLLSKGTFKKYQNTINFALFKTRKNFIGIKL